MEESQIKNKCIKTLNRLINKSRDFCNISCVPDGIMNIMKIYIATGTVPEELKYSSEISYDYDYFAFSKSTKSLLAIRQLLNSKIKKYPQFVQDVIFIIDYDTELQMEGLEGFFNDSTKDYVNETIKY